MKRITLCGLALALLMAPALEAVDFDLTGWASRVETHGEIDEDPSIDFGAEFGFGVGLNVFWSPRWATEFAVHSVEPEVLITRMTGGGTVMRNFIGINAISFTMIGQYHFYTDRRGSPYVGAGAAYALFDDVNDPGDLHKLELDEIDIDEDYGFAINGGVNWNFTHNWRANFDLKYVPFESEANVVAPEGVVKKTQIGYSPVILSLGLTYRF